MSEGKSLRVVGDWIGKYFHLDKYGSLIPNEDSLDVSGVGAKVADMLAQDPDLERDMIRKIFSTDVEFADRPDGSTPVIAGGIKQFGPSPLFRLKFGEKLGLAGHQRATADFLKRCDRRKRKIEKFINDAIKTVDELQPKSEAEKAILEVEKHQVLTGGGYDNTKMFAITRSLLDFLDQCSETIDYANGKASQILMEEIVKFKRELYSQLGIGEGTLRITSFMLVRMMQESDGMIGFPVFKKSGAKLTKDIARRISMWSGVDCRFLVKESVKDVGDGKLRDARVVDALCYVLDHAIANPEQCNFAAIIWTLARIQRHGYKLGKDGAIEAKDGKARSVSPNAAFSGAEEAMVGDPFIKVMKEKQVPWMPSLQDRETADRLIKQWYEETLVPKNMRALPADWSGYDKTVKGAPLATILYYVIRPLFHFDDQAWVDLAIVSLVFKYFLINVDAAQANPDLWTTIQQKYKIVPVSKNFVLVGTVNGLGSGAKLTHVGGSLYGELIIHHAIPRILGYEGVSGPQAGDDTSLGYPVDRIDLTSAEKTFQPIADAAAVYGLKMNAGKQIFVTIGDEVMNIFLQFGYNYNLSIWGVGTAVRYYVAYPFAEREKFLSIGEQYMAIISKFNNGVSNPWIKDWIAKWLQQDDYICALFKEYGDKAFNILVESTGTSFKEISERLEITYNWGLTQEQLEQGDVPVLPVIAEVAAGMLPKATAAEAMSKLQLLNDQVKTARSSGGYEEDMDTEDNEPDADDSESADAAAE